MCVMLLYKYVSNGLKSDKKKDLMTFKHKKNIRYFSSPK